MKKKFIIVKKIQGHVRTHWWDIKRHPLFGKTTFPNIYGKIKAFEVTCTHFTLYIG